MFPLIFEKGLRTELKMIKKGRQLYIRLEDIVTLCNMSYVL